MHSVTHKWLQSLWKDDGIGAMERESCIHTHIWAIRTKIVETYCLARNAISQQLDKLIWSQELLATLLFFVSGPFQHTITVSARNVPD